jgi:hypothetical protein
MKMGKFGYFSEFLLFPPLVLLAVLLAFRSSTPPQPAIWMIVYGAGLFSWTFIEYLLHRVPAWNFEWTAEPMHGKNSGQAGTA